MNLVTLVRVCTKATFTPLFPWTGIPSTITMQGSSTLRSGL
jgi:hypothetical protein